MEGMTEAIASKIRIQPGVNVRKRSWITLKNKRSQASWPTGIVKVRLHPFFAGLAGSCVKMPRCVDRRISMLNPEGLFRADFKPTAFLSRAWHAGCAVGMMTDAPVAPVVDMSIRISNDTRVCFAGVVNRPRLVAFHVNATQLDIIFVPKDQSFALFPQPTLPRTPNAYRRGNWL